MNSDIEKVYDKLMNNIKNITHVDSLLENIVIQSLKDIYVLGYNKGLDDSYKNDDFNDDFIS